MQCPKCRGTMRTYDRSGVHIEQCDSCRGIFLDYGELERLNQLEGGGGYPPSAPPPAYGAPGWGHHGRGHHKRGFGRMLFSS